MFHSKDYNDYFVMGIAGNTPGHLAQVGEQAEFSTIRTENPDDPKCLFPVYTPGTQQRPSSPFPLSSTQLLLPQSAAPVQLEPELALICQVHYQAGLPVQLHPQAATAYNDCTIRMPYRQEKISLRKNWGRSSKGIAQDWLRLDGFSPGGILDQYLLCAYLQHENGLQCCALDTAVKDYALFHQQLLDWIIRQIRIQPDLDNQECIAEHLASAGFPQYLIVSLGAIPYTDYGQRTFLAAGDITHVILYHPRHYTPAGIESLIQQQQLQRQPHLIALSQRVEPAAPV